MNNKSLKRLIYEYLVNNRQRLQDDYDNQVKLVKYRDVDALDVYEYQLAITRLQAFEEFSHDIVQLMRISDIKH